MYRIDIVNPIKLSKTMYRIVIVDPIKLYKVTEGYV